MQKVLISLFLLIFIFSLVACKEKDIKSDQAIGTCAPKESASSPSEGQSCKAE